MLCEDMIEVVPGEISEHNEDGFIIRTCLKLKGLFYYYLHNIMTTVKFMRANPFSALRSIY
jgi:hypothetical protein